MTARSDVLKPARIGWLMEDVSLPYSSARSRVGVTAWTSGSLAVGVLAFVAGNAGGVTRNLLIGAAPPAAINDWRYVQ